MTNVLKDFRFGVRLLLKRPGETAIAVVALGVGIGLTATMFSVVHGIYFRDLPFAEARQLVQFDRNNLAAGIQRMAATFPEYLYWREEQSSFQDIAAWYGTSIVVSGMGGHAEHRNGAHISSNLFSLLGVQPTFGRGFDVSDESLAGEPVVIISDEMWRNRYSSDPLILGQAIRINGEMMVVIGVMPEGFRFPASQDFWLPLRLDPLNRTLPRIGLQTLGRLKENVTLKQAQAELDAIARQLAAEYPATNEGIGITARRYIDAYTDAELRGYLNIMMAVVFGVLLVACANVANLLLARAALRVQELAVRRILGAGRLRLILQLLVDALLVAGTGGVLGLLIAHLGADLIHKAVEPFLRSFWIDIRVDAQVLWFIIGITLLASILAGIPPAIRASGVNLNEILKDQARGSSGLRMGRLNKALVVAQIALSCGLLVPTALMLKSIVKIKNIDLGYTPENLLYVIVGLPTYNYPDEQAWAPFFAELLQRLEALPQAKRVALANGRPSEPGPALNFAVEGTTYPRTSDYPRAHWVIASPMLFEIFNITLLDGRIIRMSDDQSSVPVAVINQSLAERHFEGSNTLGRRIRFGGTESEEPWLTIVGVVTDSLRNPLPKIMRGFRPLFSGHQGSLSEVVYLASNQFPSRNVEILIQTDGQPIKLAPAVWSEIAAIDPDVPTVRVTSMADKLVENTWDYRLFGILFSLFGFVAFLLAMLGLYAVMALAVRQRTHELGLRMALGAQPADAIKLVMTDGLWQLGFGMILGLGLAAGSARLLTALFFGVEPWDFTIFVCVASVLSLTAAAACFMPAWWASRVAPMVAIRHE